MSEKKDASSFEVRTVARVMDMAELLDNVTYTRQAVTRIEKTIGAESNGHDGHGTGILGRLRRLEDYRVFQRGALWALHILWSMLMLAGGWLIAHWSEVVKALGL